MSKEKLLQLTKQSRSPIQAAERPLLLLGHLLRTPLHLPAKMIFDFDPMEAGWKRSRGELKKRWSESLSEFLAMVNTRPNEAQTLTLDKSRWRRQTSLSTPTSTWQET